MEFFQLFVYLLGCRTDVFPLEFYVGAGVGFYGYGASAGAAVIGEAFNIGFASVDGIIWHLSETLGIISEYGWIGGASIWGIGVELQLESFLRYRKADSGMGPLYLSFYGE